MTRVDTDTRCTGFASLALSRQPCPVLSLTTTDNWFLFSFFIIILALLFIRAESEKRNGNASVIGGEDGSACS